MPTPTLPNEVWQRIFGLAIVNTYGDAETDTSLWTAARAVSRSWRANVAQAYFDTLIRNPDTCAIYFHLGSTYMPIGSLNQFAICMIFDRLQEDDKSRVVFKESESTRRQDPDRVRSEGLEGWKKMKCRAWKKGLEQYLGLDEDADPDGGGRFDKTPHILCINGCAQDSALPELEFNVQKFEMSFQWEEMLTQFFSEKAEIKRRRTLSTDLLKTSFPKSKNLGPKEMEKFIMKSMMNFHSASQHAVRDVRRVRIMRHYRAINDFWKTASGFPYFGESAERKIVERLAHCQRHAPEEEEDDEDFDPDFSDRITGRDYTGTVDLAEVDIGDEPWSDEEGDEFFDDDYSEGGMDGREDSDEDEGWTDEDGEEGEN